MNFIFYSKKQLFLFLLFSSWLFITILLFYGIIFHIFFAPSFEKIAKDFLKEDKLLPVAIENITSKEEEIDKKNSLYMSNKFHKAQGKLTKDAGFSSLSNQDKLIKNSNSTQSIHKKREEAKKYLRVLSNEKENIFKVNLWKNFQHKKNPNTKKILTPRTYLKIPNSYEFKYKNAFSWDANGEPLLPTFHYKNFDYIRAMVNKIRQHWYPPGGSPIPIDYQPRYAGSFTYRVIPPQVVGVIFMLDIHGNVLDTTIRESLGYDILNQSIIDAIKNSGNFGKPPSDFLEHNRAFFPFLFKIY